MCLTRSRQGEAQEDLRTRGLAERNTTQGTPHSRLHRHPLWAPFCRRSRKVQAAEPDKPSSAPGAHMAEERVNPTSCPLSCTRVSCHTHEDIYNEEMHAAENDRAVRTQVVAPELRGTEHLFHLAPTLRR